MLKRLLVSILWIPLCGWTATGRIVAIAGDATLYRSELGQRAELGMDVVGATLKTGLLSKVQMRMDDGSMVSLQSNGELRVDGGNVRTLSLLRGGLVLTTPAADIAWSVHTPVGKLRTSGSLKLQTCDLGCPLPQGLYGRVTTGETVIEYSGGRASVKGRAFRIGPDNARPVVLPVAPSLLDEAPDHQTADKARAQVARGLANGLEAFRAENYPAAREFFQGVLNAAPSESIVNYYLGLIALKEQRNVDALQLLQKYAREDAEGAVQRGVGQTITLLSTQQLQFEVATALARERSVSSAPPEPNSIAVQAFSGTGDAHARVLAKGIAAMVISDLLQVPGLKVLEREKVQLLLDEMQLGDSGMADPTTAARSGRLMRAEKVVVGSFGVQ